MTADAGFHSHDNMDALYEAAIPALVANHFVLMAQLDLLNTLTGVVLPQLIAPVTVII